MFLKVINIQLNLFKSAVLGPKNVAVVERKPMSKGSETRVRVWTVLQKSCCCREVAVSGSSIVHFFCRLLRFDDNEPGRQLKQPPAAFLEADSAEVRVKLLFQFFVFVLVQVQS